MEETVFSAWTVPIHHSLHSHEKTERWNSWPKAIQPKTHPAWSSKWVTNHSWGSFPEHHCISARNVEMVTQSLWVAGRGTIAGSQSSINFYHKPYWSTRWFLPGAASCSGSLCLLAHSRLSGSCDLSWMSEQGDHQRWVHRKVYLVSTPILQSCVCHCLITKSCLTRLPPHGW